jgi:hypothetical protein
MATKHTRITVCHGEFSFAMALPVTGFDSVTLDDEQVSGPALLVKLTVAPKSSRKHCKTNRHPLYVGCGPNSITSKGKPGPSRVRPRGHVNTDTSACSHMRAIIRIPVEEE